MKKPFLYALVASAYIVTLVLLINTADSILPSKDNIVMPMAMLSLFVLSVAVMGFLFFYEPLCLFIENKRREAVLFFAKVIGIFACFILIFVVLIFLV